MIVTERGRAWWQWLLAYHGTALPRIKYRLTLVVSVSIVVTWLYHGDHAPFDYLPHLTTIPFSLVGLALGVFLGFRNNTSYDRYWEGRKLWGALVNTTRSFARLSLNVLQAPEEERDGCRSLQRELVIRTAAYTHSLRRSLRNQPSDCPELKELLPDGAERQRLAEVSNYPLTILQGTSERLARARRQGWLHDYHVPLMEEALSTMMDIQGGCERIRNTPIPHSYSVLIHRIVAVYCFALSFGLVETTGLVTPIVVLLIAYAFMGLDAVGEEIEEPFGEDVNDLPLAALSRMIEINLRELLQDHDLPEPLTPDKHGTLH